MSTINIGNITNATFKVGGADCSIYLGNVKLYPQEEPTHDYSLDYFTIVSEADNNTISIVKSGSAPAITISASTDDGETWTEYTSGNLATINTGDKLLIKGENNRYASNYNVFNGFRGSGNFHVEGNSMSLLYGDDFRGVTLLPYISGNTTSTFAGLFSGCTTITSAENLVLPATELRNNCYNGMFRACTNLEKAPKVLPALALEESCYSSMFEGCISLTNEGLPEICATTLSDAGQAMARMFQMSRTTSVQAALTITPPLHVADAVYNLTPSRAFREMFAGNASLTTCTELPMRQLSNSCYEGMFKNCPNLNYIKCLATDISARESTSGWTNNVSATGTFVKHPSMTAWTTSISGIPSGWTVVDADIEYSRFRLTLSDDSVVGDECYSNSIISGDIKPYQSTVVSAVIGDCVTSIEYGVFRGCSSLTSVTIPNSVTNIGYSVFDGTPWWDTYSADVSHQYGNIIYINDIAYVATSSGITSVTFKENTVSIGGRAFQNCYGLTSVTIPNSITSIGDYAFAGCTGLTSVSIPNSVTSIEGDAFNGCSSLTSVTIGSGVTSIEDYAFNNCSGLTSVTVEATTPPNLSSHNNFSQAFSNTNNCPIYVPSESVEMYKKIWGEYTSRIQAKP